MKKIIALVFAALLVFSFGCGKEDKQATTNTEGQTQQATTQGTKAPEQIAKTIKASDFETPEMCGGCHKEIYSQWEETMHYNAHTDGFYNALFDVAREETKGEIDPFCAGCHTPIGVLSGEIPPADNPNLSVIAGKGIQCDFCHTVSGSKGIGNGAYINTPGKTKFGPFKDAVSPYHQTQYSDLHTKAEFCGMCHDVSHPGNKLPLETTYAEWKESPYAKEGVVCQDCHMTPAPGVAATGMNVPQRPKIFNHMMVGGNTFISKSEVVKNAAIANLKKAAKIEILPITLAKGTEGKIQVKVSNVGAGHYLPTGLTEARQMWIELTVKDAGGKILYQSGAVDDKGTIAEGTVMYNSVIADKTGKPTIKFWNAEKILSNYRIPPKGSVTENYTVKIPETVAGKLSIEAKLRYRSAAQEEADHLLGANTVKLPITDMASTSAVATLR